MEAYELIWIARIFAWAFLIFNALRFRLIPKYRLVFLMIFASMAGVLFDWLADRLGISPAVYNWSLFAKVMLTESLTATVLLQIYTIPEKISLRKDWHLAMIPALLVAFILLGDRDVWLFARICNGTKLAVTYLGISTIVRMTRKRGFRLGWNLRMVLLAVTVPSVFSHLVFNSHLMGLLTREAATFWFSGVGLVTWIILAAGMTEYSPPIFLPAGNKADSGLDSEGIPRRKTSEKALPREDLCITPSCFS